MFFGLTLAVALAALNTGNNLLYLVLALMLAFLALSGVFSEAALRGIEVARHLPPEIVAARPTPVALEIRNRQRRAAAFAVAVEDRIREARSLENERAAGRVFQLRIGAGESAIGTYRLVSSQRGEALFSRVRVSTRFPFGLFQKSRVLELRSRALVYPAMDEGALPPGGGGEAAGEDGGRGRCGVSAQAEGLREFASGDSARRIHWKASLRRSALVVRDAEPQVEREVVVHLRTRGCTPGPGFEREVRRAASEAAAALDAGWRVGLRTDRACVAPDDGSRQRAVLLAFLARVDPDTPAGEPA